MAKVVDVVIASAPDCAGGARRRKQRRQSGETAAKCAAKKQTPEAALRALLRVGRRGSAAGDGGLRLDWQQAFALQLLAGELAGAANRLRLLAGALLGRLLVMAAQLHLAEDALALHLLLEGFQGLIDIVVANENLHSDRPV
jgi:hypothetical protein